MRKISILVLMFMALIASSVFADEAKKDHAYVGVKKCKTCHKAQFKSWGETPHAKAFDVLSAEEQKDPACVGCHTTGTTAKEVLLEGIQCEACHGGGKDYKSAKIMSKKKWKADPDTHKKMALEAGLIMPTEKDCVRCHTKEGNPNFKPFDFAKMKDLVHPVPAKK